ncbi:MAG TPA: hypothetical protein VGC71_13130 [Gaiellales bacterium]|jgi:hypothetical protein
MRRARYHGGFDHPVRAFVIGTTLLLLLFGGFVVGIEAGTHPLEQAAVTRVPVTTVGAHTVTVQTPVVSTVVHGSARLVRLTTTETRVVVIHRNGKTIIAYEPAPGSAATSGPLSENPPTFYTVPTETVTETQPSDTVTETAPPETVTVTVTEPGSTDQTTSSTDSASP